MELRAEAAANEAAKLRSQLVRSKAAREVAERKPAAVAVRVPSRVPTVNGTSRALGLPGAEVGRR